MSIRAAVNSKSTSKTAPCAAVRSAFARAGATTSRSSSSRPARKIERSEALVAQELAVHRHHDAVALRVLDLLHVQREVDGAHDAIAALLLDRILQGFAVHAQDLVKAV